MGLGLKVLGLGFRVCCLGMRFGVHCFDGLGLKVGFGV